VRTRERYIIAMVRRHQQAEFPRAMAEAARRSPDLDAAIRAFDGGDTMAYLRRLDTDWELGAKRGTYIGPQAADRLFRPLLDDGTISAQEFAEFVKAGRYTGHPAIDAEIARLTDPVLAPMLKRLVAINEQGWNDAAKLIFGQVDRSNLQRLANHPMLYWPISYQIKATRWLAGLLFDRAFGVDTGAGGAFTLGMLHEEHKRRMATDEQYALAVGQNPTLLFVAQMFFPITPIDIGVSLSPFTRLLMAMATEDDPNSGYRRNIFSFGPGYTYFELLPRLFYEQSKAGSWAQGAGIIGDAVRTLQRAIGYKIPVPAPKSASQLEAADLQTYGNQPLPPVSPFQPPPVRQQ
jgi:hypothetical protein